jgi:hypothetical protein
MIALALVVPAAAQAQDRTPSDDVDTEAAPDTDKDMPKDTPKDMPKDMPKDKETDKDMDHANADTAARIEAHVIPVVAGIQSADKAAAVLFELSDNQRLVQKDAQRAVDLAQQGISMALDRAKALDTMDGLSTDAKSEADRAAEKLRDARTTLRQLDKQIGNKRLSQDKAQQVREHAKELHDDLIEAENAIRQVAKAYDVATDLEFGG